MARRWYIEALASRDELLLEKLVDQLFVSSYGDDALDALAKIALEQADYSRARWCWERISPQLRTVEGQPLWRTLLQYSTQGKLVTVPPSQSHQPATPGAPTPAEMPTLWLAYPDTDLSLADIRARLVLVSIMEGSLRRARIEFDLFTRLHPEARGRMGGREVKYSDTLSAMLDSPAVPPLASQPDSSWPTFAGSTERNPRAPPISNLLEHGWSTSIGSGEKFQASVDIARTLGLPDRRVAEDAAALLSYHPVVGSDLVFVNNLDEINAYQISSGQPAWLGDAHKPGRVFNGGSDSDDANGSPASEEERPNAHRTMLQIRALGVPRFTMTVQGRWLLARMGSPVTGRSTDESLPANAGYLVCLDLQSQGKLKWKIPADEHRDARWAFEGSPLADGSNVYVAMRFSDVQPQEHVACFDLRTGILRWRQMVCASESPAQNASTEEITNNLLTLDHNTLFVNTNLGAVAAMDTSDGTIRWLATYPRVVRGARMQHAFRDLNPALLHLGTVLVAPADFDGILAFDSSTGQLLWTTGDFLDGAVHLLGASGNNLWASGNLLWKINLETGKVADQFPRNPEKTALRGYGRGLLTGDRVYWPARTEAASDFQEAQRPGTPAPRTAAIKPHA
ncbi:MAG TPA: PQQ-binding-like beta-propeller repeat protein, partial [Pirellulales bacterium]